MLNLLRMNLYHLFRSKTFYICFAILVSVNLLAFGILYALADPGFRSFIIQAGGSVSGDFQELENTLSSASILELFNQGSMAGGSFAFTVGILASLITYVDFESGFIKNLLSIHVNKWDYILGKICSFCFINLIYMAGSFLVVALCNFLAGNFFIYDSLKEILFYLLSAWMVCNGFSALILLIAVLTRNKAACILSAVFLNGGLVVMIIRTLLGLFNLQHLTDFTLYMNLVSLPMNYTGISSWRPFIIGLGFMIFYTILSKIILAQKDI
jgi:ABC-2 type transport system permease protein